MNETLDRGLGDGEHHAPARTEQPRARSGRAPLRVSVEVLEDREEGDRVECPDVREVVRKAAVKEERAVALAWRIEIGSIPTPPETRSRSRRKSAPSAQPTSSTRAPLRM